MYYCSNCEKKITEGVYEYSIKNYSKALCMECQEEYKPNLSIKEQCHTCSGDGQSHLYGFCKTCWNSYVSNMANNISYVDNKLTCELKTEYQLSFLREKHKKTIKTTYDKIREWKTNYISTIPQEHLFLLLENIRHKFVDIEIKYVAELEKQFDNGKTSVDIAIEGGAKLLIEIDGKHHLHNNRQTRSDFWRDHFRQKENYLTLHIQNFQLGYEYIQDNIYELREPIRLIQTFIIICKMINCRTHDNLPQGMEEVILEDFSEVQVHERELTKEECSEPENCDPVEEFSPEVAGKTYEEILAVLEEAYEPSEDTEKRKKASQTYHDIKASQIIHELRQNPRLLANLEDLAKLTEE